MKKNAVICFIAMLIPLLSLADPTPPNPNGYVASIDISPTTTLSIKRTENIQYLKIKGNLDFMKSDDTAAFSKYSSAMRNLHHSVPLVVELDSDGGEVFSIRRIRDDLIRLCRTEEGCQIKTLVKPGSDCSSGCVDLFAIGEEREASAHSRFFLHSYYSSSTGFDSIANQITYAHLTNILSIRTLVQLYKEYNLYADGRSVLLTTDVLHDYGLVTKITEYPDRKRRVITSDFKEDHQEPLTEDSINKMKSLDRNRLISVIDTRLMALFKVRNIYVAKIANYCNERVSMGACAINYLRIIPILESLPTIGNKAPIHSLSVYIGNRELEAVVNAPDLKVFIPYNVSEKSLIDFLKQEVVALYSGTSDDEWCSIFLQSLNIRAEGERADSSRDRVATKDDTSRWDDINESIGRMRRDEF